MILFDTGGSVIWLLWYAVLWGATVPFAVMLCWTVLRVSPATSGEESTWLNGAVLAAFFVLVVTSFLSLLLMVSARPGATFWTYVRGLVLHFLAWTFLGSAVFFASLQALAAGPRLTMRRLAALGAVLGVALIHAASLYATYRFRHR